MRLITFALVVIAAFIAVWMMIVAPAERRHHQRKLESLRRRIEARESGNRTDERHVPSDGD